MLARSARFVDTAVSVRNCSSFVAPVLMPLNVTTCVPESSFTVTSGMAARVGASFTATTVRLKRLVTETPS